MYEEDSESHDIGSKRYEYYLRQDIEAIKTGIMVAYSNNEHSFICSRFCTLSYIEKIAESLKNIFIDSDIVLEKMKENFKDNEYYTIKICWAI